MGLSGLSDCLRLCCYVKPGSPRLADDSSFRKGRSPTCGCAVSLTATGPNEVSRVARTSRAALAPARAASMSTAPSLSWMDTYRPWLRSWMRSMVEGSIRAPHVAPFRASLLGQRGPASWARARQVTPLARSEEHTSEL